MRQFPQFSLLMLSVCMLWSCSALQHNQLEDTRKKLLQAGFVKQQAATQKQKQLLQTAQQHQILIDPSQAVAQYLYFDAEYCRCWYQGNKAAYHEFLRLVDSDNQIIYDDPEKEAENLRAFPGFRRF